MPVYEYLCQECGIYEQLRPVAQSAQDGQCPCCGLNAKRIISAPHLATLPAHTRKAHETNERSRHEPKVSQKPSCCSHGTCTTHGAAKAPLNGASADAKPRYKGMKGDRRPWMISH